MSARENEAFDNLQGKFFSGPSAEEVILLNDFAKEIDPKNPEGADRARSNPSVWRAPGAGCRFGVGRPSAAFGRTERRSQPNIRR